MTPHNDLLSDLVLENAVWKQHIREAMAQGEIPLWNPKILTGLPFLAAGQASTFYPLNVLFYVLPLEWAFGWFTALQVALAGINMYIFGRVLGLRRIPALYSGVVYMFSGFLIVSVVFTMFLAAVPWLPLLLAVIEYIIRKQEEKGVASFNPIPYVAVGAAIIGLVVLAGHPELIYYTMIVAGAYSFCRLVAAYAQLRRQAAAAGVDRRGAVTRVLKLAGWLLTLAVLGVGLGAVQLIPLVELLPLNFRAGSASLQQVREWAWPSRHVLTFWLPNIFGSPSHHAWFDIWARQWTPATVNALGEQARTIFWGIKNYVEGGNYLGVATWLLAGYAIWGAIRDRKLLIVNGQLSIVNEKRLAGDPSLTINNRQLTINNFSFTTWFFAALALLSLLFAFGTPLYGVLYYGLPGWNQLHSPFRWVFPFTLSMALLGGIGLQWVMTRAAQVKWTRLPALALAVAGAAALGVVLASLLAPAPFIAFSQRILDGSDLARMAFADGRMFWSYQAGNLVHLGVVAVLVGALVVWIIAREKQWLIVNGQLS
ncbi:MAG TPA: YfhO family protein, partial [Anaerolineae bacterium]|nr:YfhO family protein [Anaerolineae bacterium]